MKWLRRLMRPEKSSNEEIQWAFQEGFAWGCRNRETTTEAWAQSAARRRLEVRHDTV